MPSLMRLAAASMNQGTSATPSLTESTPKSESWVGEMRIRKTIVPPMVMMMMVMMMMVMHDDDGHDDDGNYDDDVDGNDDDGNDDLSVFPNVSQPLPANSQELGGVPQGVGSQLVQNGEPHQHETREEHESGHTSYGSWR